MRTRINLLRYRYDSILVLLAQRRLKLTSSHFWHNSPSFDSKALRMRVIGRMGV